MQVGYLGVGNMGQPMAGKLLDGGHGLRCSRNYPTATSPALIKLCSSWTT
jgi:3-hydroxyisobutyrate dehydrogenase-like beta-hydroxyacid dehydrogenase